MTLLVIVVVAVAAGALAAAAIVYRRDRREQHGMPQRAFKVAERSELDTPDALAVIDLADARTPDEAKAALKDHGGELSVQQRARAATWHARLND